MRVIPGFVALLWCLSAWGASPLPALQPQPVPDKVAAYIATQPITAVQKAYLQQYAHAVQLMLLPDTQGVSQRQKVVGSTIVCLMDAFGWSEQALGQMDSVRRLSADSEVDAILLASYQLPAWESITIECPKT